MTTTGAEALLPAPRPDGSDHGTAAGTSAAPRVRLAGVDLARGVAVLGMFAAHAAAAPTLLAADPATWGGVVHGRSSILFATLAGVSVALMTGRTTPPGDGEVVAARVRVLVRAACLFGLGGLLQLVSTPVAVILEHYAVLLVLCVPVLRWRPRRLLLAAAAVALLAPSLRVLLQAAEGASSWLGYGGQLGALALEGPYPVLVWAAFVLAGLAVGRCDLGAARVRRALVVGGVALAVLGYGASWAVTQAVPSADPAAVGAGSDLAWDGSSSSSGPGLVPGAGVDVTGSTCQRWSEGAVYCAADDGPSAFNPDGTQGTPVPGEEGGGWRSALTADQFLGAQAHSATTPEVLGSGGVALAVLGGCLWLAAALARRRAGWLVAPVAAVGAMPLTAYCVHAVALALTSHLAWDGLDAQGGGQEGQSWLAGSWQLWALFAGTALVVCPLWGRLAGRGPLERLVSWAAGRAARA
ncbi:heparan-alpha-glucosaminide N-acetyltransferase domain-containing protein [Quadrisphaera sp. KR29]|uniref:heparan-alpha-glucosaminide N-acetyltransferase domain-containing protein n=1 Tax=Quadrisphaera sp. KR29 TaxID=3461391 RepID=UPI00404460B6